MRVLVAFRFGLPVAEAVSGALVVVAGGPGEVRGRVGIADRGCPSPRSAIVEGLYGSSWIRRSPAPGRRC
jgi:hypothetical protein